MSLTILPSTLIGIDFLSLSILVHSSTLTILIHIVRTIIFFFFHFKVDGEEGLKKRFNTESARKKERESGCKTPGMVPGNCEVSHCLVQDAPGMVWYGIVLGIVRNGIVN